MFVRSSSIVSSGAPGGSGASSGISDAMDLNNYNKEDNASNIQDKSESDYEANDNEVGKEVPEVAKTPLEIETLRWGPLRRGMVCTNENYSLGTIVRPLDTHADALAVFEALELQVLTFFTSPSLMHAGGFPE